MGSGAFCMIWSYPKVISTDIYDACVPRDCVGMHSHTDPGSSPAGNKRSQSSINNRDGTSSLMVRAVDIMDAITRSG
jgi:hypothetical protein